MDWFTVLLFLFFVLFPLVQQVLEARKRPPGDPSAPPGEREREAREEWDEAWGEWPWEKERPDERPAAADAAPKRLEDPVADVLRDWQGTASRPVEVPHDEAPPLPREEPRPAPPPVPAPAPPPVRTPEPATALPERHPPLPQVTREAESRPRPPVRVSPPRRPRARNAPLAAALRTPDETRRAILLAEVLGPPRGLRPLEEPR